MFTNDHATWPVWPEEEWTRRHRYGAIRSAIRRMDADAVARQLPNLAETLASASQDDRATVRFIIGVSFSRNDTLLDYRLDRLVEAEEIDRPRQETIKPAVASDHRYLTFAYPPDPHFDATTLRGALLAALEGELARPGSPPEDWATHRGSEPRSQSWIHRLRRHLVGSL